MTRKTRRLSLIAAAGAVLAFSVGLVLVALNDQIVFFYAPSDVARRNNSTGGDSPLGNIAADSMRKRRAVEAEMALTNSLGIRDNLYAGNPSFDEVIISCITKPSASKPRIRPT